MRALLHLGLFVLALTVVGQASADHDDDDRRRERRTTVVIAPKVEHRTTRPVRAPVEPPRYEYDYGYQGKTGRHHRHHGMVEARRELFEQKRDHEEILRIADRWHRATYEHNPHAQRNAERRAHAWIEREIQESSRKRDHGRYVHRLHSLRRQLHFSHGWHGRGRGRAHKARLLDELVQLSDQQLRRARARVRGQRHLAFAYR